ncbi:MAG: 3-oxoacyl-[acyl-carrier-protein] reductase [Epulopiscium sp. Nuni2H_MBin001]|nr:MAG: 3-oxoacyl-[acyl-carrier-protein] reductase [Epulopiscium sp. Nuni2H_MBin001]
MLDNKVAVVTGSTRGIGEEVALTFAKNGANVVINYRSDSSKLKADNIVEQIEALGQKAIAIKANIADFNESKVLIDNTIAHFGKIDILVNNAGITRDTLLLRMTEEDFDQVIEVNLKGAFNCIKHAARPMLKSGGSIINMTSVVGISGNTGQVNYAASKAGLIGMTKTLAREFAKKNIRVNAIAPGFIESDMTSALSEQVVSQAIGNIPMNRLGSVKDVANVALFLASDLSTYVTGEVIRVDGGMAM